MTFQQCAAAALAAALALAWWVMSIRRNPTRPCPSCEGVGWIPKAGQGNWARGGRGCRRCDRFGRVTVAIVWLIRTLRGQDGLHPMARIARLPMPDRRGRQEVDVL
jgi:hypothetical protein